MKAEEAENWFKAEFGGDWDEQCHARFAAAIEQTVSEARMEEAEWWGLHLGEGHKMVSHTIDICEACKRLAVLRAKVASASQTSKAEFRAAH